MRSRAKEVLPPSKLRERRRQARNWRFAALSVLLLLVVAGIIGFFHIPALAVRDVHISGVSSVPLADIEQVVRNELSGRYFFVLPKNNAFLYSDTRISERLGTTFPKLHDIDVSLQNFHTISIRAAEREPVAVFCGISLAAVQESCLFMDQSGIAYEQAPEFSDNAYVRFYGGNAVSPGGHFLSPELFFPLWALTDAMHEAGLSPVSVEVDAAGDVLLLDSSRASVRFTMASKPEDVLKALKAARASDALTGKGLEEIEYIDLRFGNRLYYKLR